MTTRRWGGHGQGVHCGRSHKLAATIEVVDGKETVPATGRSSTDNAGYAASESHVACYPERVLAVEGTKGAGRPLAQSLLADWERVVDVPAKLSARVQAANRLHRLLSELVPGQSKRDITTGQASTILASVRPRDVAGKTRRQLAAEQVAELVWMERKIKTAVKERPLRVTSRADGRDDARALRVGAWWRHRPRTP